MQFIMYKRERGDTTIKRYSSAHIRAAISSCTYVREGKRNVYRRPNERIHVCVYMFSVRYIRFQSHLLIHTLYSHLYNYGSI